MRVFVAGSTGALGVPVVRTLVAAGHEVTGLTRGPAKVHLLESLGAAAVIGDVYDPASLKDAFASCTTASG